MKTFEEKVRCFTTNSKNLFDFSRFCKKLHNHIEWKIDNGNSKIFSHVLSNYLDIPNRTFDDKKSLFIFLCDRFRFEFLSLYELSKGEDIL